jgi:hypothetical protein
MKQLPEKTRERLIDAFLRTRRIDPEFTTRTDTFALGAMLLDGTHIERAAGRRLLQSVMKYAGIPEGARRRVVNVFETGNKRDIAEFCKELRPHTEVRRVLDLYTQ